MMDLRAVDQAGRMIAKEECKINRPSDILAERERFVGTGVR